MGASVGAAGPTDAELLERMRDGDERALEALYARYGGLVYALALRIVGDRELAREVLQDTFLRSWDGRETYDPKRGRVAWWLIGVARNRAIDLLRSRSHHARLREQGPIREEGREPSGPDAQELLLVRRAVGDALRSLSPVQREAVELAYYAGLTQAEIAQELGQPLGTVKSRTREAMDRLRRVLRPLIESDEEGATL